MKNNNLITGVTVLVVIAILLVGAMPAFAEAPDRLTIPIAGSFLVAQCDGFNVIDTYSGSLTFRDFYDNDGNLVNSTLRINTNEQISNSVTGFSVPNTAAYSEAIDPSINEYFIRGLSFNITVPGYGIVYFDSGLGIFVLVDGEFVEVKFSGNYQANTALLCEAMNQ